MPRPITVEFTFAVVIFPVPVPPVEIYPIVPKPVTVDSKFAAVIFPPPKPTTVDIREAVET